MVPTEWMVEEESVISLEFSCQKIEVKVAQTIHS